VKDQTIGTPGWPELNVAVTVYGEPPAVKVVVVGESVTDVMVVGAIDSTVKEAPG
jgi:hypothetical protein